MSLCAQTFGAPAYTLRDLAEDAVGVPDAFELPRAHLVGMSTRSANVLITTERLELRDYIDLSPALWGRGYATEAASSMLDFAFRKLSLEMVRSETVSGNARVAALLTRLGFHRAESEPGAEWMAKRGWTRVIWELGRGELEEPLKPAP